MEHTNSKTFKTGWIAIRSLIVLSILAISILPNQLKVHPILIGFSIITGCLVTLGVIQLWEYKISNKDRKQIVKSCNTK